MTTEIGERLAARLAAVGSIGRDPRGGVTRLALTDEDHEARRVVVDWAREMGWDCCLDGVGNLFVFPCGAETIILTGSHLDTQPNGGDLDGVYGVVAGMSSLESLGAGPFGLAVWSNEEGVRFAPTTMGSAAYAGAIDVNEVRSTTDSAGISVGVAVDECSDRLGIDVREPPRASAYIEAHIEQGTVLLQENATIGIVEGIQGLVWLRIEVTGEAGHAGTTPRAERRDALLAAVHLIDAMDRRAMQIAEDLRLTVGKLEVEPGSTNTIAGRVAFTVDIRHPDARVLRRAEADVRQVCGTETLCEVRIDQLARDEPGQFDSGVLSAIADAAVTRGVPAVRLPSGATHDARHLAAVCPTGMIFVPSIGGRSHCPEEATDPKDLLAGVDVLTGALSRLADDRAGS